VRKPKERARLQDPPGTAAPRAGLAAAACRLAEAVVGRNLVASPQVGLGQ
jgi:hypothetical protein